MSENLARDLADSERPHGTVGTYHDAAGNLTGFLVSLDVMTAVADLLDATWGHVEHAFAYPGGRSCVCGHTWPCLTATSRDALVAALRGEATP